jgi:hypothetical protein
LDADDVRLTARKGELAIRDGKGGTARKVPLHAEARAALAAWLPERTRFLEQLAGRAAARSRPCHSTRTTSARCGPAAAAGG